MNKFTEELNKLKEMTDREIQEKMLYNQRTMVSKLFSIRGWITFIGVIALISVIVTVL